MQEGGVAKGNPLHKFFWQDFFSFCSTSHTQTALFLFLKKQSLPYHAGCFSSELQTLLQGYMCLSLSSQSCFVLVKNFLLQSLDWWMKKKSTRVSIFRWYFLDLKCLSKVKIICLSWRFWWMSKTGAIEISCFGRSKCSQGLAGIPKEVKPRPEKFCPVLPSIRDLCRQRRA